MNLKCHGRLESSLNDLKSVQNLIRSTIVNLPNSRYSALATSPSSKPCDAMKKEVWRYMNGP